MARQFRRRMAMFILLLLISAAGCSNEDAGNRVASIRVLASDDRWFYLQYGNLFNMKYPDIELQVMPTRGLSDEEIYALINEHRPDVMVLSIQQYRKLAEEGALTDLQPYIDGDDFDIDNLYPALVDYLRAAANFWGLPRRFTARRCITTRSCSTGFRSSIPETG